MAIDWSENVTWNDFGNSAGVQFEEYGSMVVTAAANSIGTNSIDVTAGLSTWALDPTTNRGWIFRPTARTMSI